MASDRQILVRQVGTSGAWVAPETVAYENEAHLQALLVADPTRVPGVSPNAVAVAELGTSGGPIDVCIVDADGSLTIVECKLASNWERRRMVIGQIIDYASAIWIDGESSFFTAWHSSSKGTGLEESLSSGALDVLKNNIADGRINLCLAVDAIDSDLRRLVGFLNQVTRDDVHVTSLQLAYARHGTLEILIPSTFGGEIAAEKTRITKTREAWTRQTFLDAVASTTDRALAAQFFERVEALTDRRGGHDLVWYGSRPGGGVHLHPYGLRFAPIQLCVNSSGRLMIYGNWTNYSAVAGHDGFAGLAALLEQDHRNGSKGVPVDTLDAENLWQEALRVALAINCGNHVGSFLPD